MTEPFRIELENEDTCWPKWACDTLEAFFKEREVYWHTGPTRPGVVGSEEVLEVLEKAWIARSVT